MEKIYDVIIRFSGSVSYTVEAENEDAAKEAARKSLEEDGACVIEANIDDFEYDVAKEESE